MADPDFIARRTAVIPLNDATRIKVRPIVPDDKDRLLEAFERFSPQSRYLRFFRSKDDLSEAELRYLTEIDYDDHFAWVALAVDEPGEPGVGVARYVRVPDDREVAEPAAAVVDEFQGRGIGTILLGLLAESAVDNGIRHFRAYVLGGNTRLLDDLIGIATVEKVEQGLIELDVELPVSPDAYPDSTVLDLLRAVASGDLDVTPIPPSVA